MSLWKDPIVEETRAAGQQLAAQAGGDRHRFFEHLRRAEQRYGTRVLDRLEATSPPRPGIPEASPGA
jgi:hypothetical protein